MPPNQLPPITQGAVNRVPCPACGKPNNFLGHAEVLETGNIFKCDHCKSPMEVAGVKMVKLVMLRRPAANRGDVQMLPNRGRR